MAKIRELDLDHDDALLGGPVKESSSGFLLGMIIGAALIALGVFVSTQGSAEIFGVDAPHATAQVDQSSARGS
jgi:hypothetical protein